MSTNSSTTWQLECDICHAAASATISDHQPPLPDDWRRLKTLDICPDCIGRMTFQDFIAHWDEVIRRGRMDGAHWAEREKMLGSPR